MNDLYITSDKFNKVVNYNINNILNHKNDLDYLKDCIKKHNKIIRQYKACLKNACSLSYQDYLLQIKISQEFTKALRKQIKNFPLFEPYDFIIHLKNELSCIYSLYKIQELKE